MVHLTDLSMIKYTYQIKKVEGIYMNKTKIDWCDSTWNPVTGCFHDCEYCYARGIVERFGGKQKYANVFDLEEPIRGEDGKAKAYPHSFSPTFHRYRLNDYIGKQGRNIFVCSMADLFGDWVPDSWIEEVFTACEKAPQHNYLFLTKNPIRYLELQDNKKLIPKDNMWYGASVTDSESLERFSNEFGYLKCGLKNFFSIEPILEDITKTKSWENWFSDSWKLCKIVDWVIIGAETGKRKDKVIPKREWIENIVEDCRKAEISVFMKSSLADIWGEPLIQEFPKELKK